MIFDLQFKLKQSYIPILYTLKYMYFHDLGVSMPSYKAAGLVLNPGLAVIKQSIVSSSPCWLVSKWVPGEG